VTTSAVLTYHERVALALAEGSRFAGLHATADARLVRTLLAAPDGTMHLESVAVDEGVVPSIVELAPAAGWDEREAHDLHGIRFGGHEPLRPLLNHDPALERWVPVHGEDVYQLAVGPIHAGVIESGHFRFHLVGDRILHLDAQLFHKHRGLERAAEGKTLDEGLAYIARACAACNVANGIAYASACEQALGLLPGAELRRARTILLELERVWNHLNDIAAICAGVSLAAGNNNFAALTERARRLNDLLTGHRFLFDSVQLGRSELTLDAEQIGLARDELAAINAAARRGWRELLFNASFQDRMPEIGIVNAHHAARLGAVGPAARAAGLAQDVRLHSPHLAYEGFTPVVPERAAGDVQARLEQRALELWQSYTILEALLVQPLQPTVAEAGGPEQLIGIGRVEGPRGETSCIVERQGKQIERLRLRAGSYANWPIVAYAATNNMLPDFPLINKSFELCYACVDR
jgi:Ni,Fe-hydrogenase III large subunit